MARFINFEGPDGAGKSTQGGLLKDALAEKGVTVAMNHEPTSGDFGRMIKLILRREATAQDLMTETRNWFRESMDGCFTDEALRDLKHSAPYSYSLGALFCILPAVSISR